MVKWTFLCHAQVLPCGNVLECVQSTDDQQLLRVRSALCHTRKSNIPNLLLPISKNSDDNSNEKGEEEGPPLPGAEAAVPSPGWAGTGPDTQA